MARREPVLTNSIRELRKQQGNMTQQELADLVDVSRQTINALEAAKYSPSLDLAFRIVRVFKLPFEDVFHYR